MIRAATRVFGVIGDPVSQSLSPPMHNAWIAAHALDAVYVALRVQAESDLGFLRRIGFAGLNVTIPHKEKAAAMADRRVGAAAVLNAANVLTWSETGEIVAHNTDGEGFVWSLDQAVPDWDRPAPRALVVGAGGAARGIVHALAGRGARVCIANRTPARAVHLANLAPGARAIAWSDLPDAFTEADLIVNATSLGFAGAEMAWPFDRARPGAIAVDAVYKPLRTAFLIAAEANGLRAVDGLGMLIGQGALAFDIWFGQRPDMAAARNVLMHALTES
jgi:shikimate dehydrogenase